MASWRWAWWEVFRSLGICLFRSLGVILMKELVVSGQYVPCVPVCFLVCHAIIPPHPISDWQPLPHARFRKLVDFEL